MRMARRRPILEIRPEISGIEVNKSALERGRSQSCWNWIVLFSDDPWHHPQMLAALVALSVGCFPPDWHHPAPIGSKAWLASSARDRYRSLFMIEDRPEYRQHIDRVLSDLRWAEAWSVDALELSARAAWLEAEENPDPVARHARLSEARAWATLALGKAINAPRAHFALAMTLVIEAQYSGWTPQTRDEAVRELLETRRFDPWDSDAAGELGLILLDEDEQLARRWNAFVASQHGSKRITLFRLRLALRDGDRDRADGYEKQLRYPYCAADLAGPHLLARQSRTPAKLR
ncbi:MAG: hypothetical protein QM817_14670 [Archangium sp.]